MFYTVRFPVLISTLVGLTFLSVLLFQEHSNIALAGPKAETYWQVADVRAGMKGIGRTVIKGTKIESFAAEILGVLRNISPGRDLILCRLSGLDLDKTGVIAGMSGSPVYINDKLLGAVAYAWPYGKEPIAGITPFVQMQDYVAAYEKRDLAEGGKVNRIGLARPLALEGRSYEAVKVFQDYNDHPLTSSYEEDSGVLSMMPLRTPLVISGMSLGSLGLLRDSMGKYGMVPMQGGTVSTGSLSEDERNTPMQPGGAMCVPMVIGDFDMSSIGTVTHVEGKRVYGFGHPFMSLGACDFPLMTGYVHLIFPRQTVSFKMGSPLKMVGVINADVSTCVAGWLDRQPDMLPVSMTVIRDGGVKNFNVRMVKQRAIMSLLLQAVLNNSIDMEGDLPEEMTARLKVRIEVDGHESVNLDDIFSGSAVSGNRAPQTLFTQVVMLLNQMTFNNFENLRINKIECTTEILAGRRTADIDTVEMETDTYAPGDTMKANVYLRTFKGGMLRVPVTLNLPADLPEGSYTATVADDLANARQELRDNPLLNYPQTTDQLFQGLQIITGVKRTNLTVRLALSGNGVAVAGKTLPNLPPSMVQIMSHSRHSGAQPLGSALVARHPTDWVIQGSESLRFTVAKNKKVTQ